MSLIHMMAMGSGAPYRETITLQGSSGSPINRNFLGYPASQDANIVFSFSALHNTFFSVSKGYAQWDGFLEGNAASYVDIGAWVDPIPWTGDYWIRATNEGDGVTITELDPTYSSSNNLDQWYALVEDSSNIIWGWTWAGPTPHGGTIKVEIADDSVGTTILATGYYRGLVSSEN